MYGTADFTDTYIYVSEYVRPIHMYVGIYRDVWYIPGGVPFRRRSVGFRYDTVDRTARIFDIGGVISREDKRAPQDA